MEAFTDFSLFQGFEQYYDLEGVEWRRKNELKNYLFFKRFDAEFRFEGSLKRHDSDSKDLETIHQQFTNNEV